jgi:MFS family permease
MLGGLAFVTSIAWYIKPLWGIVIDCFPLKGYRAKYYLYINYTLLIVAGLYVILFGFTLPSLIIVLFFMNIAIGMNDVANDSLMVKLEQKHNLKGKIQAIQWMSLGFAGLIVSLLGAWIAQTFPEPLNYKIAYGIWMLLPIGTFAYLKFGYKEAPVTERKCLSQLKLNLGQLKNKAFIIGIIFIAFLRFSPSFGTALMIQMREHMGIEKMFMGWLGATGTVLGLLGYVLYYWKAHKYSLKGLLYFTVIFSALANLCYLYIPTKWHILGYSIAFGAIDGICFLAVLAFMAKIIPVGAEGLFYALITSINNFAGHLGGVIGGVIYDHFGYASNVWVASLTTLMCLAFIPFLFQTRQNKELKYA